MVEYSNGVAQSWRMKNVRYSLKGRAQLTPLEVAGLQALGKASFTKWMEMDRAQLETEFPEAFRVEQAVSDVCEITVEDLHIYARLLPNPVRARFLELAIVLLSM